MDSAAERLAFRDFELRPESGELFRDEQPVKLQQQPTRVLELLARRTGEVVSRDELRQEIWGDGHFVDSEQGLNYCVRQIRMALEDEADAPRFVETVPRRGYRFVAPVKTITASEPGTGEWATAVSQWPPFGRTPPQVRRRAIWWLAGLAAGLVVVAGTRSAIRQTMIDSGPPTTSPVVPFKDVSPEAHEAYLQGVYLSEKLLTSDRERGVEPLERAIELAPDFAPAHAAWARLVLSLHRPPLEVLPLAEAAVDRALELDTSLPEAHVVRGKVRMFLHRDWAGAEAAFRRALELAPSVEAHLGYAHLLSARGRHDEALGLVHRARELDPASALVSADLGWYYYFARRFAEAEKHSRETLKLEADNVWALSCLVLTALERGDDAGALAFARDQIAAEVASGRVDPPVPEIDTLENYWRLRLETFDGWRRDGYYVSPSLDSRHHLALGDRERAFELLDHACQERSLPLTLAVDRRFDPLRADGRFASLLECAGLGG